VPLFQPFRALRYADTVALDLVTTPPYDIISPDEQRALEALHPNNFIRAILGAQLPGDKPGNDRYSRAAGYLKEWIQQKVLVEEAEPGFWLYTMQHDSVTTAGLIGVLQLEELGAGGVYPHEQTIPGPKADRLELMRATSANLEPLWFFASQPVESFEEFAGQVMAGTAEMEVTDTENVLHRAFKVAPGRAAEVVERINANPVVVADGHHRYETALTYRDERRAAEGPGPWDFTLALIMDPSAHAPELLPIHRIARGVTIQVLRKVAELSPFQGNAEALAAMVKSEGPGKIGVLSTEGSFTLPANNELDTSFLARLLAELGAEVRYEHNLKQVEAAITEESIAFLLAPVPIELVAKKALAGERMPPKTTLFWPKPRSGLLIRNF
jgi:uncharacterized protein (DUF1015 family)